MCCYPVRKVLTEWCSKDTHIYTQLENINIHTYLYFYICCLICTHTFRHHHILLYFSHLTNACTLTMGVPLIPMSLWHTHTHIERHTLPPRQTLLFFLSRGMWERIPLSLSLCSGSLPARSGQWKNPHPDRHCQGDKGAEPVRQGASWEGRETETQTNPLNVLS